MIAAPNLLRVTLLSNGERALAKSLRYCNKAIGALSSAEVGLEMKKFVKNGNPRNSGSI